MIILIVAILSAFVGAMLAHSKGRNPFIWAIVCALFPLLGIVLLVFFGRNDGALGGSNAIKWQTLVEVDPEIAAAAATAKKIGPYAEAELATKYLLVNDKAYLPNIIENLRTKSETSRALETSSTRNLVMVALFTAIIIVLGFLPPVPIPLLPVPITAQSMGVMLAGCIIGAKRGALAYALLVLLVAIGLPVLSGGRGGLNVLMGPTGGYIFGWIIGTFVTGLLAEKLVREGQSAAKQMTGFFIASVVGGIGVVYLCGMPWLSVVAGTPFGTVLFGSLAFIPGDLVKAAIATLAARAVLVGYPLLPARA